MILRHNFDLTHHTTLKIPYQAAYYAEVHDAEDIDELMRQSCYQQLPRIILGGGSNLAWVGSTPYLVIHPTHSGITYIPQNKDEVWVKVGANEPWDPFVQDTLQRGYSGLENLSLIPGTVGAAPVQNIGAYGVELATRLIAVEGIDLHTSKPYRFSAQECAFGYRNSLFKQDKIARWLITHVTLRLDTAPKPCLDYHGLREQIAIGSPSPQQIRDAVCRLRLSKLPDPEILANAGSFFKNPCISRHAFCALQEKYPLIPGFAQGEDSVKISAAYLIEQCGYKGLRRGSLGMYERHALVLIHYGGASGQMLVSFVDEIKQTVLAKFAILLEEEVRMVV